MHLFLNLSKLLYQLSLILIFSIIESIPSICPFANLLGFPSSLKQSFIVANEFKIYSFQLDKVFANSISIKESNFDLKNFGIKSSNCFLQFFNLQFY